VLVNATFSKSNVESHNTKKLMVNVEGISPEFQIPNNQRSIQKQFT
jgi:hypothetical protein